MNYYYLKIGKGNEIARDWLTGRKPNPLGIPAAVIFFDNLTVADYQNGKGGKEPRQFVACSKPENHHSTRMVVVHDAEVWILQPSGEVVFLPSESDAYGPHTPKAMPVKVLAHLHAKEVPLVLASITANQFYTRGTFRRINDWGNFKAIDSVVGGPVAGEHWQVEKQGPEQLLECLSSIEIETLVAKLLEAKGCFVPAYRGGLMKDIDLVARNCGNRTVRFDAITLSPGTTVSFQIKRWAHNMKKPPSVDCLVGLGVKGSGTIDAHKLLSLIFDSPEVKSWMLQSLAWLEGKFLAGVIERLMKQHQK